jgi:hypothetical protein
MWTVIVRNRDQIEVEEKGNQLLSVKYQDVDRYYTGPRN